jgi:hypothetical protein
MNQSSSFVANSLTDQHTPLCACELRLERQTTVGDGTERVEYICGASGGLKHGQALGVAGEDLSAMVATCNACPIPAALASNRSCLNLTPIRRIPGDARRLPVLQPQRTPGGNDEPAEAYFPCRWFYTLYGLQQPRDTSVCQSCPHWFPRPPTDRIPGYWAETRKMLRVVNGEESTALPPTGFTPLSRRPPAGTWWQRLWQKLHQNA